MNLIQRLIDRCRHPGEYQYQRDYRRYLRGVPQAQPYILSTVKEIAEPAFTADDFELREQLMNGYLRGRREDIEQSRNSPIVGVTIEGRYGE